MNLLKKWSKTISNIFRNKNQHGFYKYCSTGKCKVCQTPWSTKQKTPTEKYLESINYYSKYRQVWQSSNEGDGLSHVGGVFKGGFLNLPEGITGEEMKKIVQILKPEYDILTKGRSEEELRKRGALEGYDQREINKS